MLLVIRNIPWNDNLYHDYACIYKCFIEYSIDSFHIKFSDIVLKNAYIKYQIEYYYLIEVLIMNGGGDFAKQNYNKLNTSHRANLAYFAIDFDIKRLTYYQNDFLFYDDRQREDFGKIERENKNCWFFDYSIIRKHKLYNRSPWCPQQGAADFLTNDGKSVMLGVK